MAVQIEPPYSTRRHSPLRGVAIICGLLSLASASQAGPESATDADVDQLIDHLVEIIESKQNPFAVIRVTGHILLVKTGERQEVHSKSYRGTIESRAGNKVIFRTLDGMLFEVLKADIDQFDPPGHFQGEQTRYEAHGGRTALATLALLSAGSSRHDKVITKARQYLKNHRMPGTYGRALRASINSHLVQRASSSAQRSEAYRLLKRDARWLVLAMTDRGGYTYRTHVDEGSGALSKTKRYDNSNSQFGTLGLWISSLAGYDVPRKHWERVANFWSSQQQDDGGWGYRIGERPTQTMTTAGINSLIIVLDQLYGKHAGKYVKFKGIERDAQTEEEIALLRDSIRRASHWLAVHGRPHGRAYLQLGLERLGLASGQKYIGTHDWYRTGVEGALQMSGWERKNIETLSMWLMFLAHGRAPVLVNKLDWGGDDSGWNYYHRDMHHACRFLSNTYEQLYRWQIIDTLTNLHDLEDAPFLYIAGQERFWLPDDSLGKIKAYVTRGGTIIGHANLASKDFTATFKRTFEKMFEQWGYKFRKLSFDHPIYQTPFGSGKRRFTVRPPIWALSDGLRDAVLLFPVDIAGAWHQSLQDDYVDLFRILANIRFYAARAYRELPGRLRPPELEGTPAAPIATLRVARPISSVDRGGAPGVWQRMNELMAHHYGVSIVEDRRILLANINEAEPYDIVHIAGQGSCIFTAEESAALQTYCQEGGFLILEALGGDPNFAASARQYLKGIFADHFHPMEITHDLLSGAFDRGKDIGKVRLTKKARAWKLRHKGPEFYTVEQRDRLAAFLSTFDLSASAAGHYVSTLKGYESRTARRILRNCILHRLADLEANGKAKAPRHFSP